MDVPTLHLVWCTPYNTKAPLHLNPSAPRAARSIPASPCASYLIRVQQQQQILHHQLQPSRVLILVHLNHEFLSKHRQLRQDLCIVCTKTQRPASTSCAMAWPHHLHPTQHRAQLGVQRTNPIPFLWKGMVVVPQQVVELVDVKSRDMVVDDGVDVRCVRAVRRDDAFHVGCHVDCPIR